MSRCCKPADYDEDRTHKVCWHWEYWDDGKVITEDHGSEIACTHNDAILIAEMVAGRMDCSMKPRGKNGTWKGSEIIEGDGEKCDVWIDRGPGEIEYDENRMANMIAEGWTITEDSWIPPPPPWPRRVEEV